MSITRNFKLFLNAGRTGPLVIHANQYDSGEQWVFSLFTDAGIPYTPTTGAIVGIKSDNLGIINTGTVVDGKVVINETQQMTAAPGRAVFELLLDDQTHGTANFEVWVEPKPGNNADLSESDLSLLQQAIDSTNPTAIAGAVSDWMDDNLTPTTPVVDASLTVQGAAADAKKTGDEISDLKSQIAQSAGLTTEIKQALMNIVNNVAWSGDDPTGQTYIDALETALYPPANLSSITAVYTQSGTVYNTDSLDSLKSDLVVTAHYDNSTSETVTTYTLSGTLTVGTSTVTVSYGGKTATFTVTVTKNVPATYYFAVDQSKVVNGYINDSGEHATLADSYYVDELYAGFAYMPVTSTLAHDAKTLRSAWYDANQDFLSRTFASQATAFVYNASASYVKVGTKGALPSNFIVVGNMNDALFTNAGYQIQTSDGQAVVDASSTATDFMPIGDATKYLVASVDGTTLRMAFYDSNKAFISSASTNTSANRTVTDIPSNAVYFRISKPIGGVCGYPLLEEL